MSIELNTELKIEALKFAKTKKSGFTAKELSKKIKCSERTGRHYCQILTEAGLFEKQVTYPSRRYSLVTKNLAKK